MQPLEFSPENWPLRNRQQNVTLITAGLDATTTSTTSTRGSRACFDWRR